MNDSSLVAWPPLHAAVRRRLWLHRSMAALRAALWSAAALVLVVMLAHLALRPLPPVAVAATLAATLLAALAWSAVRPPTEAQCAAWADRELGGASAFTTLLDARSGRLRGADPGALHWLGAWAAGRVPQALDALAARREAPRLARPLAAALVCAALALLVLALPRAAPGASRVADELAAPATPAPNAAMGAGATTAAAELTAQVASALRGAPAQSGDEGRAGDRDGGRGQGPAHLGDDGARTPSGAPPPGATPTGQAAAADARAAQPDPTGTTAPSAGGVGGSTGREAGDSADTREQPGSSRVALGTMPIQRVELARRGAPGRADDRLAADYDDDPGSPATATPARAAAMPAAATAPPAAEAARLTPSENRYVQAWMTATARRR